MEPLLLTFGKRAPNARQTLNFLYRQPIVSAADLQKALDIKHPTANALLKVFCRLGLLTEATGAERHRVYTFDPYLKLFLM